MTANRIGPSAVYEGVSGQPLAAALTVDATAAGDEDRAKRLAQMMLTGTLPGSSP